MRNIQSPAKMIFHDAPDGKLCLTANEFRASDKGNAVPAGHARTTERGKGGAMSFVRNAWYVAGFSRDFAEGLTPVTICDQRMVMFRASDGHVAALEDRCPHRLLPLSRGRRIGDTIQCGYHGMTFDSAGKCVRVPGQDNLPSSAYVDAFPVREAHGLV